MLAVLSPYNAGLLDRVLESLTNDSDPVEDIHKLADEHALAKDKAFVRKLAGEASTRMPRWRNEELELLRQTYPVQSNLEEMDALWDEAKLLLHRGAADEGPATPA